jgi:hypothetical protein
VIFLMGLMLWLVAPRLAAVVEPGRNELFRELAAGSEEAFDKALFERREVRLVLDPEAGTYRFRIVEEGREHPPLKPLGRGLAVTGIRLDGEDRPLDTVTEIRYLPGGRLAETRLFIRDGGAAGEPTDWTLRIDPFDGSMHVLEGTVMQDDARQ